jgi:hypothetical protein
MKPTDLTILALLCGVSFTPYRTFNGFLRSDAVGNRRKADMTVPVERRHAEQAHVPGAQGVTGPLQRS